MSELPIHGGQPSPGVTPNDVPSNLKVDTLLVSVEEAARLISINRSTVFDMLGRGDLPSVRIGRRRLISRQALADFVSRMEARQTDVTAVVGTTWSSTGSR